MRASWPSELSFPTPLDIVPVLFYVGFDGSGKERSVSRTYRNCQSHVQRLRVSVEVTATPGSRRHVPGVIRHLLPLCCSNPRRGSVSLPYWWEAASLPVRLCECMPGGVSAMKSGGASNHSQQLAKIAAFRMGGRVSHKPTFNRHPGESRGPFHCAKGIPAFAGMTVKDGGGRSAFHPSQALSRIHYLFHSTACWLEARTGASSPFLSQPP